MRSRRPSCSALLHAGLLALTACGRLSFDVVGDDGVSRPDDAGTDAPACSFGPWSIPVHQPFDAVNDDTATDWGVEVSANGLTVVFASDRTGEESVYIATRPTLGDDFGAPAIINALRPQGFFRARDPSLSTDELDIYYTIIDDGGQACIYTAHRNAIGAAWNTPARVADLCFDATRDLGGPYISHDEQHLYYDINDTASPAKRHVFTLTRPAGGAAFQGTGEQLTSLGDGFGWCVVTRDELTIICEGPDPTRAEISTATRPSFTAAFGPTSLIEGLGAGGDASDPSLTADGTMLVYASDAAGSHDLRVAVRDCR